MKNVFILAAGDISNKLPFIKPYYSSPALIPINTRALILYHLDFYKNKSDCNIYIIVNQGDSQNIKNSVNLLDYSFEIIEVANSNGVIKTLYVALGKVVPESQTIITLVTSIPTSLPKENTIVLHKEVSTNIDWSCIKFKEIRIEFLFRSSCKKDNGYAFTGIFSCETIKLKKAAAQLVEEKDLMQIPQKLYRDQIPTDKKLEFVLDDWIDVGHEVNYSHAKSKLLCSRSFNTISINKFGLLTKESTNYEKLKNEVKYIKELPTEIRTFYPEIVNEYSFDKETGTGKYEMEFYDWPNVAELQLFWDLTVEHWNRIFLNIEKTLHLLRLTSYEISFKEYESFFIKRLKKRTSLYYNYLPHHEKYLVTDRLTINGLPCESFKVLEGKLIKRIAALYSIKDFSIVHGDLCFNNILYDITNDSAKLIDPRGSFGFDQFGIYGDFKYDLAKLLHSAIAGYDYIVNNLYSIEIDHEVVSYKIFYKPNQHTIQNEAIQLVMRMGYSLKDIMLIVGLLFITMPPLHNESALRQKIMYLHGIKLINENL